MRAAQTICYLCKEAVRLDQTVEVELRRKGKAKTYAAACPGCARALGGRAVGSLRIGKARYTVRLKRSTLL